MSHPPAAEILIVEDELLVREVVASGLRRAGHRVLEAASGPEGLRLLETARPALTILDINLPGLGGFAILEAARKGGIRTPILLLSSESEIDRRVAGLDLGADDFLAKPFDVRELHARVAALLRRGPGARAVATTTKLVRGGVLIDLPAKRAERDGARLPLTATEFALLEVLARHEGRPVSKEELLHAVWGYTSETNTRTVETHLWRLRKKLGDDIGEDGWIQNRPGIGYLLTTAAPTAGELAAVAEPAV